MAKSKSSTVGPMSVQPNDRTNTARNQRRCQQLAKTRRSPCQKSNRPGWPTCAPRKQELRGANLCGSSERPKIANRAREMLVQFLESIPRLRSRRYDSPCTVKRCSSLSPPRHNFVRYLESCSRAPFVSERSASVPYRLSAIDGEDVHGPTRSFGPQQVTFTASYC